MRRWAITAVKLKFSIKLMVNFFQGNTIQNIT